MSTRSPVIAIRWRHSIVTNLNVCQWGSTCSFENVQHKLKQTIEITTMTQCNFETFLLSYLILSSDRLT